MAQKRVKITMGDLEGEVLPQSVHVWEERGWTVVDDGSSETSSEVPAEEPQTEDPNPVSAETDEE